MILALVVLSVIVLFHEFGHFLLARLNGITVVEFSLGFGPRLLSHVSKKSGTRYSWKLFPFGGSCAMLAVTDAGLAASIFHTRQVEIRALKEFLRDRGVAVRL